MPDAPALPDTERSPMVAAPHRQSIPPDSERSRMVATPHRQSTSPDTERSPMVVAPHRQSIPSDSERSRMVAAPHRQSIPYDTERSRMVVAPHRQSIPPDSERSPMVVAPHRQSIPPDSERSRAAALSGATGISHHIARRLWRLLRTRSPAEKITGIATAITAGLHIVFPAFLALSAFSASVAFADITVEDDRRQHITLPGPATRIVSLAPHLTELVYRAGAGQRLVAVSKHCDYPADVQSLPRVSDYRSINLESIAQLQPDLILVWGAGLKTRYSEKLRALAAGVYISEPQTFADVADNLTDIGILTGNSGAARKAAQAFLNKIETLATANRKRRPTNVLYLIHDTPPVTVNGTHWISHLLSVCSARNVFADADTPIVHLNAEAILLRKPDYVVHSAEKGMTVAALPDTPVLYIPADWVQRPTTRLYEGAQRLCSILPRLP